VEGEADVEVHFEYAWLIETSDDGERWIQDRVAKPGMEGSAGFERARSADEVAMKVAGRELTQVRPGDRDDADWDELWCRITVWDVWSAVDWAGLRYGSDHDRRESHEWAPWLKANKCQPHAVQVRTPSQIRAHLHQTV
jgi:hypothetical protein